MKSSLASERVYSRKSGLIREHKQESPMQTKVEEVPDIYVTLLLALRKVKVYLQKHMRTISYKS